MNSPDSFYQYKEAFIRVVTIGDCSWFSARDVCEALRIPWSCKTLDAIPDTWKDRLKREWPVLGQESFTVINEKAVLKLALSSNESGFVDSFFKGMSF